MSDRSRALKQNLETIGVIEDLTEVFQNTASVKIRAVRKQVLNSKLFFNDLWQVYRQLRVESRVLLEDAAENRKTLRLFISSPAGLGGASDAVVLQKLRANYDASKDDVMVLGSHGSALLHDSGIQPVRAFELPDISKPFTVQPIVDVVRSYAATVAYYQSYVSLTVQQPSSLNLLLEAQTLTEEEKLLVERGETEIISSANYIFEPSLEGVCIMLEAAMIKITLTQLVQESGLAQLAGRFTTMTLAHDRAKRRHKNTVLEFLSARRTERDEITREIMVAAKGMR